MKGLIAAVVVLCLAAGIGWWWWTNTPQYAVTEAKDAVKAHNVVQFHKWVDVEEVSSSAVDDLSAIPVQVKGSGLLDRVLGFAVITFFKPSLVEGMSKQIDKWVAHRPKASADANASNTDEDDDDEADEPKSLLGAIVQAVKPPSLKQVFRDYGLTKRNYRGLGAVESKDHIAHVGLRFFSPKAQKEVEITLELNNTAGHWQVTRISNLQQIVPVLAGG
ncbi:MAG TPA: hypothetical protein V6D22_25245 [Candidatus Obscuribacterales bacterium]